MTDFWKFLYLSMTFYGSSIKIMELRNWIDLWKFLYYLLIDSLIIHPLIVIDECRPIDE